MVPTDAVFGAQADLYKNATKILNKGGKITQTSKTVVLHNVMMRNIDDNVRKVNTMMLVLEKDADETDYYTERYESYKKVATLEDYDTGHTIEATEDEIAASNARFVLEATKAGNYHPQLVMQLQNSQHLSDSQIAQLMGNASAAGASLDGGGGDDGGGSVRMTSSSYSLASAGGGMSRAGTASISYLGSIAEGWDWEEEKKMHARMARSATLVPVEAQMNARSLDKEVSDWPLILSDYLSLIWTIHSPNSLFLLPSTASSYNQTFDQSINQRRPGPTSACRKSQHGCRRGRGSRARHRKPPQTCHHENQKIQQKAFDGNPERRVNASSGRETGHSDSLCVGVQDGTQARELHRTDS